MGGTMYDEMKLNPKAAASGARFLEGLNQRITDSVANYSEDDIALIHPQYLVRFCDDGQRRAMLHRAAQMQVGLLPESRGHLPAMKRIETAVRESSFAFVSTLPHFTKDYCARLKAE